MHVEQKARILNNICQECLRKKSSYMFTLTIPKKKQIDIIQTNTQMHWYSVMQRNAWRETGMFITVEYLSWYMLPSLGYPHVYATRDPNKKTLCDMLQLKMIINAGVMTHKLCTSLPFF